jgi:hypothetical protein
VAVEVPADLCSGQIDVDDAAHRFHVRHVTATGTVRASSR